MKRTMIATALALMITSGTAMAETPMDLPKYDSAAFCDKTSSIIVISDAFKKTMINSCMEKEKNAPDQIRRIAPFIDAATMKSCVTMQCLCRWFLSGIGWMPHARDHAADP